MTRLSLVAWLLMAGPALAGTVTEYERRLELPGVLIEDFGPDLRYYAAGMETGRFDDNPRALRVTRAGVTFVAGGVDIACVFTPTTMRVGESGNITTHTLQGSTRRSSTLTWRVRQFFDLACTYPTASVQEEVIGRYLQTRTITLTRGDP